MIKSYVAAAASVLILTACNQRSQTSDITDSSAPVEVFRHDSTPEFSVVYRIPAIASVKAGPNKGRIVALNDYRYCGSDIGFGRIDLYQSLSDDLGKTWTVPGHMRDSVGNPVAQGTGEGDFETSLQHPDAGFGDAAIVSDRETGKLLVLSVCGYTPYGKATRENPNQVARWYSSDGADSWTPYENITEDIYTLFDGKVPGNNVKSMFFGSGRLCQSSRIKVGDSYRVYGAITGRTDGATCNWVLYSDDFGKTWAVLGDPMTPAVPTLGDEPKVEELPDGSVVIAARSARGKRSYNVFTYSDPAKAEGTWGDYVITDCGTGININACDGEILIVQAVNDSTGTDCYVALQSFPFSEQREKVGLVWKEIPSAGPYSPSMFETWQGSFELTPLPSGYSTMVQLEDGSIGALYEEETHVRTRGSAYCGVFRRVTLDEITGGKYKAKK